MAAQPVSVGNELRTLEDSYIYNNRDRAIAHLTDLLQRARKQRMPDMAAIANGHWLLAYAYGDHDQHERGIAELDALATELRKRKHPDDRLLDETLRRKAVMLNMVKRGDEAEKILQQLMQQSETAERTGDKQYFLLLDSMGLQQARRGNMKEAEALFRKAITLGRGLPDVSVNKVAESWNNWIVVLNILGDKVQAVRESESAAKFAEERLGEYHATTANNLNTLAVNLDSVGRYAESEAVQRRVLEISTRISGEDSLDAALALANLAGALKINGHLEEARTLQQRAVDIYARHKAVTTPSQPGEVMLSLATIEFELAREDDALRHRREAIALLHDAVGDQHPSYGFANFNAAQSLVAAKDFKAARPLLDVAVAIFAKAYQPRQRNRMHAELLKGVVDYRNGDPAGYALALDAAQRIRASLMDQVGDPVQTLRNAGLHAPSLLAFADLALEAGHPDQAFDAMQLAQLGELDSAGSAYLARQAPAQAAASALARELQDAQANLGKLRTARNQAVADSRLADVQSGDAAIVAAETKVRDLRMRMLAAFPAYERLLRPEPQSLGAIQSKLPSDEALLIAMPHDTGVLSMLVMRKDVQWAKSRVPGVTIAELVRRMRASIDAALESSEPTPFDVGTARQLHAAIMPPELDRHIAKAKRLMVMGGGALASVPYAALVTSGPSEESLAGADLRKVRWLIHRQAVEMPVSLRAIAAAENDEAKHGGAQSFAGIGAPSLHGDAMAMRGITKRLRGGNLDVQSVLGLSALPQTAGELASMRSAFRGDSVLLTGDDATESRLKALDLTRYDVIAFATHGLVSGALRGMTEPSLVLTPASDGSDDGLLTASEIAGLKLDADWVILSACDTSAGDSANAPMYSGLARAFVFAGARSLLLSHWQVRDDVASRLSVETVRAANRGMPRAEALRAAQRNVIADKRLPDGAHPATWAPFILVGR